jgi:hypothetical protein
MTRYIEEGGYRGPRGGALLERGSGRSELTS